jgi:hypothetical protein
MRLVWNPTEDIKTEMFHISIGQVWHTRVWGLARCMLGSTKAIASIGPTTGWSVAAGFGRPGNDGPLGTGTG